jgi:hypothetical protein
MQENGVRKTQDFNFLPHIESLLTFFLSYCPTVFILEPGQMVHINKGRLHAFRKMSTQELEVTDCHATLRAELLGKVPLRKEQVCFSIAWDWMYRGVTERGIAREVAAVMTCASLNRLRSIKSLGAVETVLLHLSRAVCDREEAHEGEHPYQPSKKVICRGIVPGLQLVVQEHKSMMEVARANTKTEGTRDLLEFVEITDADRDPIASPIDAYGRDYTCRKCLRELSNIYCHCTGCESLFNVDYNLCVGCHDAQEYKTNVVIGACKDQHSGHMHTGKFSVKTCNCKPSPYEAKCPECLLCARCCCKCHTNFSVRCRFFKDGDEAKLLKRVQDEGKRPETYAERFKADKDSWRKCALWPLCLEDASYCKGYSKELCRCYREQLKELPTEEELKEEAAQFNETREGKELVEETNRRKAAKRKEMRLRERAGK